AVRRRRLRRLPLLGGGVLRKRGRARRRRRAGRMNRKEMEHMSAEQTDTATISEEQILQRIREALAEQKVPGAETAPPDATWEQLDVDSLELVELVTKLEDEFQIKIEDAELKMIPSLRDAAALVLRLARERAAA